jgi:hypothetical protein
MFIIRLFFFLLVVACLALLYNVASVVAEGFGIEFFRRDTLKKFFKKIKYFFVKLYDSIMEWSKHRKAVAGGEPKV